VGLHAGKVRGYTRPRDVLENIEFPNPIPIHIVLSTYHSHTRHLVGHKLQQLEKMFEILKDKGHSVSIVEQKFNLDLTDYYNLSVDEWEKMMHEKRAKASMAKKRDTEKYWIKLGRRKRRYAS
jgi:hypothetical protein